MRCDEDVVGAAAAVPEGKERRVMGFDEGTRSFRLAEDGGSGDSGGGGFMSENKRGEEIERKGKPEKPFEISMAEVHTPLQSLPLSSDQPSTRRQRQTPARPSTFRTLAGLAYRSQVAERPTSTVNQLPPLGFQYSCRLLQPVHDLPPPPSPASLPDADQRLQPSCLAIFYVY
nr:hypothetical protein Iba_chr12cCG22670 [Ipomoea batatas]